MGRQHEQLDLAQRERRIHVVLPYAALFKQVEDILEQALRQAEEEIAHLVCQAHRED